MLRVSILALSLTFSFPAQAYPCWLIRQAVAKYGEAAVEAWARSKGMSERQILDHRKCLR